MGHSYVKSMKSVNAIDWWSRCKTLCNILGLAILAFAAANFLLGYKENVVKQAVHKYVLINDASGSVVDQSKHRGIGVALSAITAGNKALIDKLDKRNDGSRDLLGAMLFDHQGYIVSYLVDDPKFVESKLDSIFYNRPPLGGGTRLDIALWGGIELVINHDDNLSKSDLLAIETRMYSLDSPYRKDDKLDKLIAKCLPASEGSSLIIFTDGIFNEVKDNKAMSGHKLLKLCKELKIRVYMISVESIMPDIMSLIKETGGDGIIRKTYNVDSFKKIYEDIVNSQAQETIVVQRDAKKSLGTLCGIIAASLLTIGFVISQTFGRKYTEV